MGDAEAAIRDPSNEVSLSVASVWEIAIKRALGKLEVPGDLTQVAETEGFNEALITSAHAQAAGALPLHHRDPFDRLLIAQAQAEELTIVTHDSAFRAYEVDLHMV